MTRKDTLTVSFHTFLPSEIFGWAGFFDSLHPAGSPGGIQLVKKVPLDFFAKLLPELQNRILYYYFAILPLRRVIERERTP